jgi:hypothetical protein
MGAATFSNAKALVERINVDRFLETRDFEERTEDSMFLRLAADKLREAAWHWQEAASACEPVLELAPPGERELLSADIDTFLLIASEVGDLAALMDQGILPPNGPVHRVSEFVRHQEIIAERRAVAYQGLPGHLPRGYCATAYPPRTSSARRRRCAVRVKPRYTSSSTIERRAGVRGVSGNGNGRAE